MKSDNPLMRKLLSFLIALALIFGAAANSFAGSMMLLGAGSSTGGGGGGGSPVFVSPPYFSGATTYSNANRTVLITGASAGIQANTALTGKKVFSAHFDVLGGGGCTFFCRPEARLILEDDWLLNQNPELYDNSGLTHE
jgi:hypothetical protein